METSGHTQHDEPAEQEHAEDEHTESEAEDDDTDSETAEYDDTDYEQTGSEHTDYEGTEYETVYHTSEFRMSAPAALIRNQVAGQKLRIVQFGAMIGEDWGLARAAVKEKLTVAGSTIGYGAFSFTHPLHPMRRKAAKEAHKEQKKLAAGKDLEVTTTDHGI